MLEFEPGLMVWTTVSFGILVLLLYKAALPPILSLLSQREKMVADNIATAEDNRKKSEDLLEEYKRKLSDIHRTADQVVERAKADGDKLKAEILEKAEARAKLTEERARQDLIREKENILSQLRKETAQLVALAAGKVLRRTFTLDDNRKIIEESLKEVSS